MNYHTYSRRLNRLPNTYATLTESRGGDVVKKAIKIIEDADPDYPIILYVNSNSYHRWELTALRHTENCCVIIRLVNIYDNGVIINQIDNRVYAL